MLQGVAEGRVIVPGAPIVPAPARNQAGAAHAREGQPIELIGIAVRDAELSKQPKALLRILFRLIEILVERIGEVVTLILYTGGSRRKRWNKNVVELQVGAWEVAG